MGKLDYFKVESMSKYRNRENSINCVSMRI